MKKETEIPYNVSEWKRVGIERGYYDYFKDEIRKKDEEELIKMLPVDIIEPKKLGRPRKKIEGQLKISKVKLLEVSYVKQLIKNYYDGFRNIN